MEDMEVMVDTVEEVMVEEVMVDIKNSI